MPANSADGIAHLEGCLRASLSSGDNRGHLQQQIVASSKKVLMEKVPFHPAANQTSFRILESMRNKYTSLNSGFKSSSLSNGSQGCSTGASGSTQEGDGSGGVGLPQPQVVLYSPSKIMLEWHSAKRIGAGLINMGNTCFFNSTMQCLTYCPPLVNYLSSGEHSTNCTIAGFCMLCELQRHVKRCQENNSAIKPSAIVQKLKMIARHMTFGQQEDAHEFLRYVIDAMQRACLHGQNRLDKYSKETTVVNQIFSGYLRSQVLCLKCKGRSNTYDPFMDLSLDIKNVQSVQKALEKFVAAEILDNGNACYNCPRCKNKVPAQKRFTIHKAPNVLTLQLKRFDANRFPMTKLSKHIAFPERLDIQSYMSTKQGVPIMYELFAVLVHIGHSCTSGHYYCYSRAANRFWYCLNDSSVQQASLSRVLNADAYLLFYVKCKDKTKPIGLQQQKPMQNTNGPSFMQKKMPNGSSVEVPRRPVASETLVSSSFEAKLAAPKPVPSTNNVPLPEQRKKISFGMKSKLTKENQDSFVAKVARKPTATVTSPKVNGNHVGEGTSANSDAEDADRIVLTIKDGKVYNGSLGNAKGAPKNGGPPGLVPYNDESSGSDEDDSQDKAGPSSEPITLKRPASSSSSEALLAPKRHTEKEPVFDRRLNTTVNVPGAYKPLDQESKFPKRENGPMKDRCSPAKRVNGDTIVPLQINVPISSAVKVNATTSWNILDQDAQVSPSVASNASSASVNSTGVGWQVSGKEEARKMPLVPEAQCNGWTVTPLKHKAQTSVTSTSTTESLEKLQTVKAEEKVQPAVHADHVTVTQPVAADVKTSKKSEDSYSLSSFTSLLSGCAGSTYDSDTSQYRKKDKKKKKKKKKHKRKSEEDEDDNPSKKQEGGSQDSSDESSENYVWVEKTKESLQKGHSSNDAPAQSWDHHVKDGYRKKEDAVTSNTNANNSNKWDGTRTTSVVSHLERFSANKGYGAKVSTWDGGKSELAQEAAKDAREAKKRRWDDEYEEELDRGRVKKVKSHQNRPSYNEQDNPFQRYQEQWHGNGASDDRRAWLENHQGNNNKSGNNGFSRDQFNSSNHYHSHQNDYHGGSRNDYHNRKPNGHYRDRRGGGGGGGGNHYRRGSNRPWEGREGRNGNSNGGGHGYNRDSHGHNRPKWWH